MRFATAVLIVLCSGVTARADLEIRGFEAAHGRYGARRDNPKVYHGEEVFFRYQVTGAEVDRLGRIDVELDELVSDLDGKKILHARDSQHSVLALGGGTFTGQAVLKFPDDAEAGSYRLTLKVTDKISGSSTVAEQVLELVPVRFALVMPRFSYDPAGEVPAPAGGLVGQALHVSVKVLGLDSSKSVLDADMKLQLLDDADKPILPQPITVSYRQDDPKVVKQIGLVRFKADLVLNREGRYTLKMTVTDRSSGKKATFSSPLVVTAP